jgi:hypothetical protein
LHYPAHADIDKPLKEAAAEKNVTDVLIIITVPLTLFRSCRLLLAPLAAFTVSLCAHFVFVDAQIGKRPHFVQLLDSIAARNVQLCT